MIKKLPASTHVVKIGLSSAAIAPRGKKQRLTGRKLTLRIQ